MGIGNLTNVLRAYAAAEPTWTSPISSRRRELSWPRVFFDTAPDRHAAAHELLADLGDDSPTYYWRVLAAREIMRLYRDDPERLEELDLLHAAKSSAEEVLHPPAETERFVDGADLQGRGTTHVLQRLPTTPAGLGFGVDGTMGELAPQLGTSRSSTAASVAEALALLVYLASRVQALSGATQPLEVTSAVRDDAYQELLREDNAEAARGYSLHTTGYAFDIRRRYESGEQAQAFQFLLDDLNGAGPDRVDPRAGRDPRHRRLGGGGARGRDARASALRRGRPRRPARLLTDYAVPGSRRRVANAAAAMSNPAPARPPAIPTAVDGSTDGSSNPDPVSAETGGEPVSIPGP